MCNCIERAPLGVQENVEAIVVLGQSLNPDGSAPATLTNRARTAAALYLSRSRDGTVVIASGGDPAGVGRSEASVMRAALIENGVPSSAILAEEDSWTTLENAWFVIDLLRARGIKRAFVVTSDFHAPRARLVFEAVVAYKGIADTVVTMHPSPHGCPSIAGTGAQGINSMTLTNRLDQEEMHVSRNLASHFQTHIRGGVCIPTPGPAEVSRAMQELASLRTGSAPFTLRVVTYNIAGGKVGHSLDKIVAVLHSVGADVICLQEVFQLPRALLPPNAPPTTTQAHLIAERLRMNCVFGEALIMHGLSYGNAILSRFRLHSARHMPLPRGSLTRDDGQRMPGAEEPRLALAVTVSPSDDVWHDVHIVCTHLGIYNRVETVPDGPACQAPATITAFCNEPPRRYFPTVLLGDLNATPESVVLKAFAQTWTISAAGKGLTTKKREIDHVLTRNCRISDQRVLTCAETHAGTDSPASDHLPVVATCVVPTWAVSGPAANHYLEGYASGPDGVYVFSTLLDAVTAARAAWTAGCRGVTQEAADRFTLRRSSALLPSARGETSWTLQLQ